MWMRRRLSSASHTSSKNGPGTGRLAGLMIFTRLSSALASASVRGRIVGTAQGPKINGFTYKRRTNQRRRYGHRQQYSVVEITSITA